MSELENLTAECERLKGELAQAKGILEGRIADVKSGLGGLSLTETIVCLNEQLAALKAHNAALLEACQAALSRMESDINFDVNGALKLRAAIALEKGEK
jgi:hypothetical protein